MLGVPARRAREDLKLVAAVAPVAVTGRGRDRVWIVNPAAGLGRFGVLDRISLRMGREVAAFLDGTSLHDGLARASDQGWDGVPDRFTHNLDRKFRHLQEPARSYTAHRDVLDGVIDALIRERTLAFRYEKADATTTHYQGFHPLTLVVYRRAVYVLGTMPGREGPLRLSVDRMRDVTVGAPAPYPDAWEPDVELGRYFGIVAAGEPSRVVLRFAPRVAHLVRVRAWHPTATLTDLPDGRVELAMRTGGPELVRFALEWGATCEVIEPAWLREAVVAELRGALAAYGG